MILFLQCARRTPLADYARPIRAATKLLITDAIRIPIDSGYAVLSLRLNNMPSSSMHKLTMALSNECIRFCITKVSAVSHL